MFRKKQPEDSTAPRPAAPGGKGLKSFFRRHWKPTAAVVCVAAAGAAILIPKVMAQPASAGVEYIEVEPELRSIVNVFSESGTIEAAETYEVRSLVRGDVLTSDFEEGDMVEKGTTLYTIDSSDAINNVEKVELSVDQAQRDYDDAVNAQYVRTDIGGTVISIDVAPGDAVSAGQEIATIRDNSSLLLTLSFPAADAAGFSVGQSATVTLDGTYETITGTVRSVSGEDTASTGSMLVRSVVISVPNTSGSLTSSQAATASVNGVSALGSARFTYQKSQTLTASSSGTVAALCVQEGDSVSPNTAILQLTSDSLTRQVESASDNLRSAQLSLDDAENTLDDYTITAPISGTIIQKNIQAGETIGTDTSTSETLCIIHDLSYLELVLNVDELEILSIQEGQEVTIVADAISDKTFDGVVTNVSSAGTTTGGTTTYPVTIRIDDYGELMPGMNATAQIVVDSADDALPSTSEILYSIIDGSIVSTLWESLTSSPSSIISYLLNVASDNTSGVLSSVLGYLGKGANYVCYIDGENTTLQTSVKYPVIAGGIAVGKSASGTVKSMVQLMPVMVDQLGAASVKSGDTRYETADDMQVYLWYKGQYFPTTLSQINTEDYYLIGWYDNFGCTAGNKIRVLVAVQKD